MSGILHGKHIVLGITGSIAAYKAAQIARLLVKAGAEVQVIMTPAAIEFITPLTMSTLTGKAVIREFFTANTGEWHSHVKLGLWADAMLIAPATAATIAKMATGVADNMLITSYLSCRAPVFVAPAMDLDMMAHPSTVDNLALLQRRGVTVIEPGVGELASHLSGRGRLEEPERIVEVLERHFATSQTMAGKHLLVTAGPTYENIDPVRYIGNYSSGRMGYAIADAARRRGARVTLVSGPVALPDPEGVTTVHVTSALEMLAACQEAFADADYAVMAAAVADYRPAEAATAKLKREGNSPPEIRLVENPDIAATLGAAKRPGQRLAGFALETHDGEAHAAVKLQRKHLDMIVLNSPGRDTGFGTDTNRVTILTADGRTLPFPLKSKDAVADDILDTLLSL